MSAPRTASAHDARLVAAADALKSVPQAAVVVDRLAKFLSDALVDPDLPPPPPRQPPPTAAASAARPKTGPISRKIARKPSVSRRVISDDDDEREADELAAAVGPPPPGLPAGSTRLFTHTFVLALPAHGDEQYDFQLETVRDVLAQAADPAALDGEAGVDLGELHLDFSPDHGPVGLLQPPVDAPRPTPKTWSSPSYRSQLLLQLGGLEKEIGTDQGVVSGFTGKHRSDRSWLSALAFLSSPASYPNSGTAPRAHASLSLALHPTASADPAPADLAYDLRLTVCGHLTPAAFANELESAALAEAQRRLLVDVLPFPARPQAYEKHGNATTIPFLFEVLGPAPDGGWAEGERETLRNPPGLNVDLLPFQQRTVKWLLAREGVRLAPAAEARAQAVFKREVKHEVKLEQDGLVKMEVEDGAGVKLEDADVKLEDGDDGAADSDDSDFQNAEAGPSRLPAPARATPAPAPAAEAAAEPLFALVPHEPAEGGTAWAFETHALPLAPPTFGQPVPAEDDAGEGPMAVDRADAAPDHIVFNRLSGELGPSEQAIARRNKGGPWDVDAQRGGMLCEEMGLGKTIEVMALLMLHRSPPARTLVVESHTAQVTAARCRQVKATLIVSPESLITQWKDELEGHSPGLRVLVYNGYKSLPFKISTEEEVERARQQRELAARRAAERERVQYVLSSSEDEAADNDVRPGGKRKAKSKGKGGAGSRAASKQPKQAARDEEGDESLWWDYLDADGGYDVVLCSYATLDRDLAVAAQPKQRPRRGGVEYDKTLKPRSPLVMVEWWRLAMDEVQLSGTPRIEEMVSLLPRVNSLAVSGTPAKSRIEDLRSTLQFLREFPTSYFPRLVEPGLAGVFEKLFRAIATRTTKAKVTAELTIPPQIRYLVPIDLTAVELVYYDTTFSRALEELQFDHDGNGFGLVASLARYWVHTLRQISTHVQIGGLAAARNVQHDRRLNLGENLLSMAEVLVKMIDSNAADIAAQRRSKVASQIDHGQLLVQKVEYDLGRVPDSDETRNDPRRHEARELFLLAVEHTEKDLVELIPAAEAAEAADAESNDGESDAGSDQHTTDEQRRTRHLRGVAIQRVRDVRGLRHRALMLLGDWYHVNQDEETETRYYGMAEVLLLEILARPERIANQGIKNLSTKLSDDINDDELDIATPDFSKGIQSMRAIESAEDRIRLLAKNGALIASWRKKLIRLLQRKVEDLPDDEEVAALAELDEYARDAELQGIIDAHMQAYLVAIADRREILDGHRDQLAVLDLRPVPKKSSIPAGASRSALPVDDEEEEILDLGRRLMRERSKCMLNPFVVSRANAGRPPLKSYLHDLINTSQTTNSNTEAQIAATEGARLKKIIARQTKIVDALATEAKLFDTLYNLRVTYFKDKQQISDSNNLASVFETEVHWYKLVDAAKRKLDTASARLGGLVSRGRFLEHMDTVNRGGDVPEEDRTCAICFEPFSKGILPKCSHMLCTDCYRLLFVKYSRRMVCPTCREPINSSEVNRIILAVDDAKAPADDATSGSDGAGAKTGKGKGKEAARKVDRLRDLNVLPVEDRRAIAQEVISGTWGTKIDYLVKHLLYLAAHDRGYKAIVFSAFPDGLAIIQRALTDNGVLFSAASQKNIRTVAHEFKTDDSKRVFLLHGERESSGLTLTCAKYVFLLEPTVSPSFELQAVGRVDRMGQTQETKVFCLFSQNTVDESIVHLQMTKGTSIYLKTAAGSTMPVFATNPDDGKVEGADRKRKTGDFVAKTDDLAALLFPERHLFGLPARAFVAGEDEGEEDEDEVVVVEEDDQETVMRRQLQGLIAADAADQRAGASSGANGGGGGNGGGSSSQAGPGPATTSARRAAAQARSAATAAAAAERRALEYGAL